MSKFGLLVLLAALCCGIHATPAAAKVFDQGDDILLQTSLWTTHYRPDEDHTNNQRLLSVELQKHNQWAFGLALFRNSFNQPSEYLFVGYRWMLPKTRELAYFKLTGGILHGYTGEHDESVPFNYGGFSPAILPHFGVKYKRFQSELVFFGTAGVMLSVGVNFPIGSGKQD